MSDKVLISISEKEDGIEVRVAEDAYDNLALIGLLERIKYSLIEGEPVQGDKEVKPTTKQKYDA
jgi:hypothetical protein